MVERRLGRGLDFFLSGGNKADGTGARAEEVVQVELTQLRAGSHQPREQFPEEALEELARSIQASGVLQPILVRKVGDGYEIIAGERRWRAAQAAGLERIPALVREIDDQMAAVFGLVENVQRADLNAIEKAKAFKRIQELTKAKQEEVARRVGLDRSTVANFVRLLELPAPVQDLVSRGTLTMGHARALLALPGADEQQLLAEEVVRHRLSVRQVEEMIQELAAREPAAAGGTKKRKKTAAGKRPAWLVELEENLTTALGTSVRVRYTDKRSKIEIECRGREEFERVYERLVAPNE